MKRILIAGSDRFKSEKQEALLRTRERETAEFNKLNFKVDESCRIYHDNHQDDLFDTLCAEAAEILFSTC